MQVLVETVEVTDQVHKVDKGKTKLTREHNPRLYRHFFFKTVLWGQRVIRADPNYSDTDVKQNLVTGHLSRYLTATGR